MQLALSKYGTRVVQKTFEVANCDDLNKIVRELEPHIEDLLDSQHGNHVLQKIVEVLPSASLTFVVEKIKGKGISVARHQFGCRVLERLIEHCDKQQLGELLDEIVENSAELAVDRYGNFVIQHLLQYYDTTHEAILERFRKDLAMLVDHKNGSWVVEKALEYCGEDFRQAVLSAVTDAPNLAEIACHRNGSHVLEKLAEPLQDDVDCAGRLHELRMRIKESEEKLRTDAIGKKVLGKFGILVVSEQEEVIID
jgi:pumilio RNA-binding family